MNPSAIEYDSRTNGIYVSDSDNDRVMYFHVGNATGTVVAGGNGRGNNTNQLAFNYGLYLDTVSNSLWIPNCGSNNVVHWVLGASNWTLVAGYLNGTSSSSASGFKCARDIILDPMGNAYIADRDQHRIQFFSVGEKTGITIAGSNGIHGNNNSLLSSPLTVMLDGQLNFYVLDYENHRIQKFLRY